MSCRIVHMDNLEFLEACLSKFELVYIDPPFNTGSTREHKGMSYQDSYDDYIGYLRPRLAAARDVLTDTGSMFVHVDPRESHYVKVELDKTFGRQCFMNEIIWAYDYGARSKKKWPAKHDVIFWYAKDPKNYTFNFDAMDRLPYMAPGLVGPEKAARGKTPTDVWWQTVVPTNGKERTGYPTQKPVQILERIVKIHSNPGDTVLDFFAGSGTTGAAALKHGRSCVMVDNNEDAVRVMRARLNSYAMRISEIDDSKANTETEEDCRPEAHSEVSVG